MTNTESTKTTSADAWTRAFDHMNQRDIIAVIRSAADNLRKRMVNAADFHCSAIELECEDLDTIEEATRKSAQRAGAEV